MRKTIALAVILFSMTFAQHGFERRGDPGGRGRPNFISYETHVLPAENSSTVYYAYRVPYRYLIFLKDDSVFEAHFRLALEIYDSKDKFVKREILQEEITASGFDDTQSDQTYFQGITSFDLPDGSYSLTPVFQDLNTDREIKLRPYRISASDSAANTTEPIVVAGGNSVCGKAGAATLANFDSDIPFSEKPYNLIFPVKDTSVEKIHVTVLSRKDTIYNSDLTDTDVSTLHFFKCGKTIAVNAAESGVKTKNFILKGLSGKLPEGPVNINVRWGHNGKEKRFISAVRWINKPFSLRNSENAIKLLKHMASDSTVSRLLDGDSDLYGEELFRFWHKYDPTPATQFNPLMSEYYTRADYANLHFRFLSGKGGVDSDRGNVYLIYGRPDDIIRSSDNYGRVVEKWVYSKLKRQFVFVDKDGSGNFVLE